MVKVRFNDIALLEKPTGRHLCATNVRQPCGITQCYLPPDTGEYATSNPIQKGWYSIYLPWMDGRLS